MHLYTWIQLVCLFMVYLVKHFKKTALAFPFVLMIFIVFRQLVLPKVFSDKELKAVSTLRDQLLPAYLNNTKSSMLQLDGEEEEEDDEWMDKDFYENAPIPV